MNEDHRLALYLRALSRINSGQAHDIRTQLGTVSLQLGLVGEMLRRTIPSAAGARAQIEPHLEKAASGWRQVHLSVERILGQTQLSADDRGGFDLVALLGELETLVTPFLREGRRELALALPGRRVELAGGRGPLRQVLLIALVELLERIPHGGRLELRLEVAGNAARLAFVGSRSTDPPGYGAGPGAMAPHLLEVVAAVVAPRGGTVAALDSPEPSRDFEIRLPMEA